MNQELRSDPKSLKLDKISDYISLELQVKLESLETETLQLPFVRIASNCTCADLILLIHQFLNTRKAIVLFVQKDDQDIKLAKQQLIREVYEFDKDYLCIYWCFERH